MTASGGADRWFVGCRGDRYDVEPVGGRPVWFGGSPLWAVGPWAADEITVATHHGARVALFGCCLASGIEVDRALTNARRLRSTQPLHRLAGSFAAVLDLGDERLVGTDLAGLHPIHLRRTTHTTWFCSAALPLADLGSSALDEDALAARLVCPGWDGAVDPVESAGRRTLLTQVRGACGGETLRLHRDGTAVRAAPPLAPLTPTAAAPALATALHEAVIRRTARSLTPSADLSGGLDSSSLLALAACVSPALRSITYVDHLGNDDDLRAARTVGARLPSVDHHTVTGDDGCLPYGGLGDAPLTDEPSADVVIRRRTRRRLLPAMCRDLHLGGDGGDVVLAGDLTYLGDLARSGRRADLARECAGWARLRHRPARSLLRGAHDLARTSWPAALDRASDELRGRRSVASTFEHRLSWARVSPAAAWITGAAASRTADWLSRNDWRSTRGATSDAVARRNVRWHGAATRGYMQLAREYGIVPHAPFLDDAVVAVCLAVPVPDRTTVATTKPLLRTALSDRVPAAVLARRTKGNYSAADYHGLRRNAAELRTLLTDPRCADLGVVEPGPVRAALDRAVAGLPAPLGALADVVAVEVWLRALTRSRDPYWRPATRRPDSGRPTAETS